MKKKHLLYIAWSQALLAMLGSLYFSEILKVPICPLCWYQRIFMYPLVFIIPIGILRKDKGLSFYVFPLSIIGGFIALYHYFLQMEIIPQQLAPCLSSVSCVTKSVIWFGFLTLPLLSFFAFASIALCMIPFLRYNEKL